MINSNKNPELRWGQMTLGRMLGSVALVAAGCAFVPRIFNRLNDDIGSVLSVVLFVTLLVGAGIGLFAGGAEWAFRGALLGLLVFLVAGAVLVIVALIKFAI